MSSQYELRERSLSWKTKELGQSGNDTTPVLNLLGIFFKSSLYLIILGTVSKEKFLYPKQESTRGGVWLQEVKLRQLRRACRESLFWRVAHVQARAEGSRQTGQHPSGAEPLWGAPLQKQCHGAVNHEPLCSTVLL